MIQVELKPETEARLIAEARAKGIDASAFAGDLIEELFQAGGQASRKRPTPESMQA